MATRIVVGRPLANAPPPAQAGSPLVRADLPGVRKEDVQIEVQGDTLLYLSLKRH